MESIDPSDKLDVLMVNLESDRATIALLLMESEMFNVRLQFERIRADNDSFSHAVQNVNDDWLGHQKRLFADIKYLLISLAMLDKLFVMLERALKNNPELKAVRDKYDLSLKAYVDFRDHLEHIYQRVNTNISDLGNLVNSSFTFDGKDFDIGINRRREVEAFHDDLIAAVKSIASKGQLASQNI